MLEVKAARCAAEQAVTKLLCLAVSQTIYTQNLYVYEN